VSRSKKNLFKDLLSEREEKVEENNNHSSESVGNGAENQKDTSVNVNVYESVNESTNENANILDMASEIATHIKKNTPIKKKFEDRHSKQTYWLRNDVLKALNIIAGNQKGKKTEIINEALEDYFQKKSKDLQNH